MNADASLALVSSARRRDFLLRRLHSLSGVLPVGVFLAEHLWTNAHALAGQAEFDRAVRDINALPLLPLLEIFGIFLPLGFHAIYGVKLAFDSQPNVGRYPLPRNWFYLLQRVSGLVALLFIGFHLWEYRVAKLFGQMSVDSFYPELSARLSSTTSGVPVLAIVYLVGIAASVFHFANGLWSFSFSWGLAISRRSQRLFGVASAVVGVLLFTLGTTTALHFATGAHFGMFFGANGSGREHRERCSVVNPPPTSPGSTPRSESKSPSAAPSSPSSPSRSR